MFLDNTHDSIAADTLLISVDELYLTDFSSVLHLHFCVTRYLKCAILDFFLEFCNHFVTMFKDITPISRLFPHTSTKDNIDRVGYVSILNDLIN